MTIYHSQSVVWQGDGTGDYEVVEGGDWAYILWNVPEGAELPYCGVFTTIRCLVTTIKAHYGSCAGDHDNSESTTRDSVSAWELGVGDYRKRHIWLSRRMAK